MNSKLDDAKVTYKLRKSVVMAIFITLSLGIVLASCSIVKAIHG